MNLKRVVVTGIGAITPVGNTAPAYWEGLLNGVSGADFITLFDASKFKTRFACEDDQTAHKKVQKWSKVGQTVLQNEWAWYNI